MYSTFTAVRQIKLRLTDGNIHKFKHGLGPCGRTVIKLQIAMQNNQVVISQVCTDNAPADHFYYERHSIQCVAVYQTDNPNPAKEQNNA